MMFIIENYLETRKRKIEAWENAREKWLNSGDQYEPRYSSEYHVSYPVVRWDKILGAAIPVAASVLVVAFVGFFIYKQATKPEDPNKKIAESAQTEGKNCQAFNKEDHVRVQYGDYKGNNGTIIGGCEANQEYQVKLDANQWASISNDGNSQPVDVSNKVISVDDKQNLVKIEVPEEKKTQ
jgi:membrane protein implicated in regulation of membrane protease activity